MMGIKIAVQAVVVITKLWPDHLWNKKQQRMKIGVAMVNTHHQRRNWTTVIWPRSPWNVCELQKLNLHCERRGSTKSSRRATFSHNRDKTIESQKRLRGFDKPGSSMKKPKKSLVEDLFGDTDAYFGCKILPTPSSKRRSAEKSSSVKRTGSAVTRNRSHVRRSRLVQSQSIKSHRLDKPDSHKPSLTASKAQSDSEQEQRKKWWQN